MCETHAYDYAAFGRLIVPTALKEKFQTAFISKIKNPKNACVPVAHTLHTNQKTAAQR